MAFLLLSRLLQNFNADFKNTVLIMEVICFPVMREDQQRLAGTAERRC
jgi:hypothetical protein